jgi:hypothetical protein
MRIWFNNLFLELDSSEANNIYVAFLWYVENRIKEYYSNTKAFDSFEKYYAYVLKENSLDLRILNELSRMLDANKERGEEIINKYLQSIWNNNNK